MRFVAKRKQAQARKDAKWRKEYLAMHQWCEIGHVLVGSFATDPMGAAGRWAVKHPCGVFATELHEIIKRSRGGSITDPLNVLASCRTCHMFTEYHPNAATELGLLRSNPKWRGK